MNRKRSNEKQYVGKLIGTNVIVGIVVSCFNEFITGKLLDGAWKKLTKYNINVVKMV